MSISYRAVDGSLQHFANMLELARFKRAEDQRACGKVTPEAEAENDAECRVSHTAPASLAKERPIELTVSAPERQVIAPVTAEVRASAPIADSSDRALSDAQIDYALATIDDDTSAEEPEGGPEETDDDGTCSRWGRRTPDFLQRMGKHRDRWIKKDSKFDSEYGAIKRVNSQISSAEYRKKHPEVVEKLNRDLKLKRRADRDARFQKAFGRVLPSVKAEIANLRACLATNVSLSNEITPRIPEVKVVLRYDAASHASGIRRNVLKVLQKLHQRKLDLFAAEPTKASLQSLRKRIVELREQGAFSSGLIASAQDNRDARDSGADAGMDAIGVSGPGRSATVKRTESQEYWDRLKLAT